MKYINLFIQKVEKDKKPTHSESIHILFEIIQNQQVSIVLGSPGSGKTSILDKYNQDNPSETQLVTILRFLRPQFKTDKNISFLLLDGLEVDTDE